MILTNKTLANKLIISYNIEALNEIFDLDEDNPRIGTIARENSLESILSSAKELLKQEFGKFISEFEFVENSDFDSCFNYQDLDYIKNISEKKLSELDYKLTDFIIDLELDI